jgi:hypothetical protein
MLTRPDLLLRLEALFVLLASVICYSVVLHGRWPFFALLFLAPDITLLGYLSENNRRMAAAVYNAAHSYAAPVFLGLIAFKLGARYSGQIAVIWIAHIAVDRFLGFGLKYPQAFKPTHIQNVGVYRSQ